MQKAWEWRWWGVLVTKMQKYGTLVTLGRAGHALVFGHAIHPPPVAGKWSSLPITAIASTSFNPSSPNSLRVRVPEMD
jgi:hypothetical protein